MAKPHSSLPRTVRLKDGTTATVRRTVEGDAKQICRVFPPMHAEILS